MLFKFDSIKVRTYNFKTIASISNFEAVVCCADADKADCLVCDIDCFGIIRSYKNYTEPDPKLNLNQSIYGFYENYPVYVSPLSPIQCCGFGFYFNAQKDKLIDVCRDLCNAWKNGDKISVYIDELEKLNG